MRPQTATRVANGIMEDPYIMYGLVLLLLTSQIHIVVDIGGTKGSQSRTQLALWESDGVTELTSDIYFPVFTDVDVDVGYIGLTVGATYYISVDGFNNSSPGTFTLCLQDAVDYDFLRGGH